VGGGNGHRNQRTGPRNRHITGADLIALYSRKQRLGRRKENDKGKKQGVLDSSWDDTEGGGQKLELRCKKEEAVEEKTPR